MPRIVVLWACLAGGCLFQADYRSGQVKCSDGKCPSGLTCRAVGSDMVCVDSRIDAAVDVPPDMPDATPAALTCSDPGPFPVTGGTAMGTTVGRSSMIASPCNGSVMNGLDAVYRIAVAPAKLVSLSISTTTGGYQVAAYMIAPCTANAACMSNSYATAGNPVTITTTATSPQFIVVDSIFAGASGNYTLNVTVN